MRTSDAAGYRLRYCVKGLRGGRRADREELAVVRSEEPGERPVAATAVGSRAARGADVLDRPVARGDRGLHDPVTHRSTVAHVHDP